ncbi:MAG TPA: NIPSNAP family protein [Vicinamibacterales bacterium]|nr:NIPSNAP family protein [Vicinamibacterales bacterium]
MKKLYGAVAIGAAFVLGFVARGVVPVEPIAHAQSARIFELRTYTAPDGKLADLHARFKNHTTRIFKKHGIENIAYFAPMDAPLSQNTLIYLIAHPSREAADQDWAAFQKDPEWQKVANESQVNGKIVAKVERVFMNATDYSPMK